MPFPCIGIPLPNGIEQIGFIANGVGEDGVTTTHHRELVAITVA
jgi:hypothetical protein